MAEKISASIINIVPKKDKNDVVGTMLVLDAVFPDKHPLAGKPVCKFMNADFDLDRTSKKGWSVEFTKDGAYVNQPLIDRFDIVEHALNLKMDRAIDAGLAVHV